MNDYIPHLQNAILAMHGSQSIHIETVPVKAMLGKQVAWDGEVEVFKLSSGQKCYAWAYVDGQEFKATAVLETTEINSPEAAVHAAIISSTK